LDVIHLDTASMPTDRRMTRLIDWRVVSNCV